MTRYPASIIQKQFWLLHKIQPENSAYNIPSLFRVKGGLDVGAFKRAVKAVVLRHEDLRSTFYSEQGVLSQIVHEDPDDCISFTVNSKVQKGESDNVREAIARDIGLPFDLEKGPLLRVVLTQLSEDEWFLLIIMHHIVIDLHSKSLFAAELSDCYNSFIAGKNSDLSSNVTQYGDYSLWQQEYIKSEQFAKNMSFWRDTLSGRKMRLNLPIDKTRPVVQGEVGGAVYLGISAELNEKILRFCKTNNLPVFLVALGAYAILMYRYSGQREITIGVPFSNRRQAAYKDTVGCFVNVLPITCTLSPSADKFEDVLQQLRKVMLQAHRNQEVPYEMLVKELQPDRDPSYNPLFQTGFTFEPPMELHLTGVKVDGEKVHNHGAQMDLYANLWELEDGLHGLFEYNNALFERETVERFVGHFQTLLQSIIGNPTQPVDQLSILPVEEMGLLLKKWNETEVLLGKTALLHKLFENQVPKSPDATACSFGDETLSYRELDEKSTQLAHLLRSKGVTPGVWAGVFMERSLDMLVALLAVLKAGGAYVPLDPDFPQGRLEYMLENSGAVVLLTSSSLVEQIPPHNAKEVFVDDEWENISSFPVERIESGVVDGDLAYVIYTSGSTGLPKGVKVHHRAVVNFLNSMEKAPGLTSNDVLLAVTTLSFDIAMLELFLPLSVGAEVVIAPREGVADGGLLRQIISAKKISVMQATPTTWHLLIAAGWQGGEFKALCGGEPMPADLAKDLMQRAASVWNLYGPTETTIWSTCHEIKEEDETILVGKPINNTQTYIVDKYDQPTPIGVAGELLIGGVGVTKGYHERPNLTAKCFVPDIFSGDSKQLLYRTGDMATCLADGNIKVHGRIDQQIKLRGYRIELGEIEAVLLACDEIEQAAVMAREFGPGDQRLVAYYTEKQDGLDPEQYRKILQEKLPKYMVPSFFERLAEMPLTANGKIARGTLPTPVKSESERSYEQAESKMEQLLCEIWSDVLQVKRVGVNENFFDIGGNSLLSLQVVGQVEKKLQIKVPTIKFFQYPTVSSFALFLSEKEDNGPNELVEKQAILRRRALLKRKKKIPH